MDSFSQFIDDTPLWLLIIFLAVFSAMCIAIVVLIVRIFRRK